MGKIRFESLIGVGLLALAIVGFILTIILNLPKNDQVSSRAQTLPEIPRDLFSADNQITQQINKLSSPKNVPVSVGQDKLGRKNVFENF